MLALQVMRREALWMYLLTSTSEVACVVARAASAVETNLKCSGAALFSGLVVVTSSHLN